MNASSEDFKYLNQLKTSKIFYKPARIIETKALRQIWDNFKTTYFAATLIIFFPSQFSPSCTRILLSNLVLYQTLENGSIKQETNVVMTVVQESFFFTHKVLHILAVTDLIWPNHKIRVKWSSLQLKRLKTLKTSLGLLKTIQYLFETILTSVIISR